MAWTVYGDDLTSGDLTGVTKFQPVTFGQDLVLRAVRTWVIVYNDPVFTSLNMKIYSNDNSSGSHTPKKLLATSTNVQLKASVHTEANAVKELWFEFDYPVFNGADIYNIVINGVGYSPTPTSHLAWMKGFPNPVYSTGYTPSMITLPYAPYELYFIGAEL